MIVYLSEFLRERRKELANHSWSEFKQIEYMSARCKMPEMIYYLYEKGEKDSSEINIYELSKLAHGCNITTEQLMKIIDKRIY